MKKRFILGLGIILLGTAGASFRAAAQAPLFNWGESGCEIQDEYGNPLTNQLILLIGVGANGVIDPPDADGVGGDDVLLAVVSGDANPNYINPLEVVPGVCSQQFSYDSEFSNLANGDVIYLRAYNGTTIANSTYYGNSPTDVVDLSIGFDATPDGPWQTNIINPYYTSVVLAYFKARPAAGGVLLKWATGSETANIGFQIYRSRSADGPYEELANGFVPSQAIEPAGAFYTFFDWTAEPGVTYYYVLQDVPAEGMPVEYGPVSAQALLSAEPRVLEWEEDESIFVEVELQGFNVGYSPQGHVIEIPTFSPAEIPGQYLLPIRQFDYGVPPQGNIRVELVDADTVDVYGVYMEPYYPLQLTDPTLGSYPIPVSEPPATPVSLSSVDFLRDQRIAHVLVYPVRYIPEENRAVVYLRVRFRITWSGTGKENLDKGYEWVLRGLDNYLESRRLRVARRTSAVVSLPEALRVRTDERTLYRIPEAVLADTFSSSASSFVLKGLSGEKAHINSGGYLVFLGGAGDGFYTPVSAFLIYPGTSTRTAGAFDAAPSGASVSSEVECEREQGEPLRYIASMSHHPPEEKWIWKRAFGGGSVDLPFALGGYTSGDVSFHIHLINSTDVDASVEFVYNGSVLAGSYTDISPHSDLMFTVTIPQALLVGTEGSLTMNVLSGTQVLVKGMRAVYSCSTTFYTPFPFRVTSEGDYSFSTTGEGPYLIFKLSNNDINEVAYNVEVTGTYTLTAHLLPGDYIVAGVPNIPDVLEIKPASYISDPAGTVDYLIITPQRFASALNPLIQLRTNEGMNVRVFSAQQIYDTFAAGNTTPAAIKEFLAYAYNNWGQPSFVLFVGDTSYDCLGVYARTWGDTGEDRCVLPSLFVNTNYYNLSVPSDNALVSIAGNDSVPDIAFGRLPVKDVSELRDMVQRIVDYENDTADESYYRLLFFADKSGDFLETAKAMIDSVPEGYPHVLSWEGELSSDQMRAGIVSQWQKGGLFVHYIGHGSTLFWGADMFFSTDDLFTFNTTRPVVFAPLTCLNAFYTDPVNVVIAEGALLSGNAVAAWASTGSTTLPTQRKLFEVFYDAVFRKGIYRIGQAAVYAKTFMERTGDWKDVIVTWTLLGDPALKVKVRAVEVLEGNVKSWPPPIEFPEDTAGKEYEPGGGIHIPVIDKAKGSSCNYSGTSGGPCWLLMLFFACYLMFRVLTRRWTMR